MIQNIAERSCSNEVMTSEAQPYSETTSKMATFMDPSSVIPDVSPLTNDSAVNSINLGSEAMKASRVYCPDGNWNERAEENDANGLSITPPLVVHHRIDLLSRQQSIDVGVEPHPPPSLWQPSSPTDIIPSSACAVGCSEVTLRNQASSTPSCGSMRRSWLAGVIRSVAVFCDIRTIGRALQTSRRWYDLWTSDLVWKNIIVEVLHLEPLWHLHHVRCSAASRGIASSDNSVATRASFYDFFVHEVISCSAILGQYAFTEEVPSYSSPTMNFPSSSSSSPLRAKRWKHFSYYRGSPQCLTAVRLHVASATLGQEHHSVGRVQLSFQVKNALWETIYGCCRFSLSSGCFVLTCQAGGSCHWKMVIRVDVCWAPASRQLPSDIQLDLNVSDLNTTPHYPSDGLLELREPSSFESTLRHPGLPFFSFCFDHFDVGCVFSVRRVHPE